MFLEIGFPRRELMEPEKMFIKEISNACALLQNPYQKIIDCNNDYYYMGAYNSQFFRTKYHFHRMIRMSKRLHCFASLTQADQVLMLKTTLVEMMTLQSILMYNSDRQSWRFIDVSNQLLFAIAAMVFRVQTVLLHGQ